MGQGHGRQGEARHRRESEARRGGAGHTARDPREASEDDAAVGQALRAALHQRRREGQRDLQRGVAPAPRERHRVHRVRQEELQDRPGEHAQVLHGGDDDDDDDDDDDEDDDEAIVLWCYQAQAIEASRNMVQKHEFTTKCAATDYKEAEKKHAEDMAKLKTFAEEKFEGYAEIYAKALEIENAKKELENAEPNVAAQQA